MTTDMSTRTAALVAAAVLLCAGATACGSEDKTNTATTSASTSASASAAASSSAAPSSAPQGQGVTVADYLRDNGISQTLVKRGEPGTPQLNLPIPPGWRDLGADAPEDAWGAIVLDGPAATDPPAVIARMARLSGGEPDAAEILKLAPNALRNQPGYQGSEGQPAELGGFQAAAVAGTVQKDGAAMFVARKTVVIPGQDGMYLLALDAQGTEDQQAAITDAMSVIDAETTIEP
ncbi:LpqN/LpqT family lipoprotein [Mycolicibacterium arseniciresistens]|uniref:LpqN/LpqT family lipoprotein n=1 Tax=Mycolicibacterium arseniciresistens TaxID=3062257 RepID=A0ABT8UE75_9MYCO|nr:LpqN/LpqT family lipoprotein [Mycolicibacterium arseniciresistens]MDO3636084.1 LpqN/LpqT family lipoprotein [Mycolicibacterium arseniciresistens]